MERPALNWFGGSLLTKNLIDWAYGKGSMKHLDSPFFLHRVASVLDSIFIYGLTVDAAKFLQLKDFFTKVDEKELADRIKLAFMELKNSANSEAFGNFDLDKKSVNFSSQISEFDPSHFLG